MEEYAPPRYKLLDKIGEGVHGVVIKAEDQSNKKIVAIKKLLLKNKFGGLQLSTLREIKVLQYCDCEHVRRTNPSIEFYKLFCVFMFGLPLVDLSLSRTYALQVLIFYRIFTVHSEKYLFIFVATVVVTFLMKTIFNFHFLIY